MKKKRNKRWKYGYNAEGILIWRQHRKLKLFIQWLLTDGRWSTASKMKDKDVSVAVQLDTCVLSYNYSALTAAEIKVIKMKNLLLQG